jgi:SAM-dependent methyltransferase
MTDNSVLRFYDDLADYYDEMIRFEERLVGERQIIKTWSEKYRYKKVLDAGCGSGLHAIVLKKLGIDVIGTDISQKMIEKARINAQRLKQSIEFRELGFDQLDRFLPTQFDAVFILGNSLPHITSPIELADTLDTIRSILRERGLLIIQMLNYDRILKNRERIVSINRHHDREFIRFYDFSKPLLRFNVLSIVWEEDKPTHSLSSTELYPYTYNKLQKKLESQGFKIREQFGSMKFDAYLKNESKDCIIVAES